MRRKLVDLVCSASLLVTVLGLFGSACSAEDAAGGGGAGETSIDGAGGAGAAGEANGPVVSYADDVETIFVETCSAGCHSPGGFGGPNGSSDAAGHDLTLGQGYSSLVGAPSLQAALALVGTGLDDSYLWHKLNGTQASVGGDGLSMPYGDQLNAAELSVVKAWLEGGAQP